MRNQERPSPVIWIGVALTALLLITALAYGYLRLRALQQAPPLPVIAQVADFTLTNQLGNAVSLGELKGRVWVADIIFTRCAGPCLRMSRQMKELQQALPRESRSALVSLTTDPLFDTPEVLQKYAARFEANPGRWLFLTGTKQEIAKLAIDSLKLTAIEKKESEREDPNDLFIHSSIFVVVDKSARLRGVFETEGEGVDPLKVRAKILASVRQLEREP